VLVRLIGVFCCLLASWLIDAGESPKAVMHQLGQADPRATARYVHVLDETGESGACAPSDED
jgi:uncharacterized Ntn-hydrolase superfamily protein